MSDHNGDRPPCRVDESILQDPTNEETASLDYYFHATAHLLNLMHADAKLRSSPLYKQVMSLVEFWDADPSERNNAKAYDAALDTHLVGTVGKALWYLWDKDDPQLRKEMLRLAYDEEALVGTQYLFYIAGTLAAKGFDVSFATIELQRDQQDPLPFVVDDILVGFDDERSKACLEVLTEFAQKTQVLVFTHHSMVAQAASELGKEKGVFVHELAGYPRRRQEEQ